MALNLYNKAEFIASLLNEHEKGYSNFYSIVEIGKSMYGREFADAVWKHLNTNIEFTNTSETVTMIEAAMHPHILVKLNEKQKLNESNNG
ncbi:MAG: hypothetical protein WC979_00315 [Candidatus Pacearchaeota archaeon]|jgi:hypothetical protein|nr:hypothetical protein [Clostridia bacterium]